MIVGSKLLHTETVTNSSRLEELLELVAKTELVAIDTETDGLSRFRKVIGISFATSPTFGFYVPLYIWNGTELVMPWKDKERVLGLLKQVIYNTPKKWIGHNIQFDDIALHNLFGQWITKSVFSDTKLLHHSVVSEDPPHGLKPLAVKHISKDADQSQKDLEEDVKSKGGRWVKQQKDFYMADPKILGKYAAMDAILTYQLHELFYPQIVKQGLQDLWFNEVLPLNEVMTEFNSTGIKLDIPYFQKLKEEIKENIIRLEEEIFSLVANDIADYEYDKIKEELTITAKSQAGKLLIQNNVKLDEESPEKRKLLTEFYLAKNELKRVFNLDSADDKAYLLYDVLGLECETYTKSGKRSVDRKTLDELLEQENESGNEVIKRLQKRAKERKLLTTYVEAILERNIDGYIYPEFDQTGTTSGRFSSRGVLNYQTLPRDDLRIKKGHIAEEGKVFVNADFCLHPKTELLTKRGWVPVLEINESDEVWQVDKDSLAGNFVKPQRVIKREYNGTMYSYGNRRGFLDVTENHTMLYVGQYHAKRPDKEKLRWVELSQEGVKASNRNMLLASFRNDQLSNFSKEEIWKACAIQADGSISYFNKERQEYCYHIEVSVEKKKQMLTKLFGPGIDSPTIRKGHTLKTTKWNTLYFKSQLLEGKFLKADLIGTNQVEEFLKALAFFDGHIDKNKSTIWGCVNKDQVECVQTLLVTNGYEAKMNARELTNPNHNTFYTLRINKTPRVRLRAQDVKTYQYSGEVGCVTVPSGFILVRSNGQTFVTGNCALEPRCFAYMSSDDGLKEIFWNNLDMYAKIAIDVFGLQGVSAKEEDPNFLKKIMPAKRQLMKQVALAVPYGSGDWKIGQIIGEPTEVAHNIIEDYLNTYPNLRAYMIESEDEIINDLEVRALTGRKRRSSVIHIVKKYYPETDFRDRGQVRALYRQIQFKPEWIEYVASLPAIDKPKSDRDFFYMVRNELNNAKNFKIQSLAAAIANAACIQVFKEIKEQKLDAKLVLQVHDEITLISSKKDSDKVAAILKNAMENNWVAKLLDVPMKADPIVATNLGDAK